MEVTEVGVRLVRRYWVMLVLVIALPVAIVGAVVVHSPSTYTAHARLMASPTVPQAQAQADAVVSEVQAIATSQDLVANALQAVQVQRNAADVVKAITVAGLGSSGIVDLSYTDTSAEVAQKVTTALTDAVVQQISGIRSGIPGTLDDLNALITLITDRRAATQTAGGPQGAAALASINQLITDLSNDRDKLELLQTTVAVPVVVDSAALPVEDGRGLAAKIAIAAMLGLALGLLLVGANETLRPGVSGVGRVARLLNVPTLGRVGSDPAALSDIGRRLRLASRQADVSIVVLMRADRAPVSPELVDRLRAATLRPDPVASRTAIPDQRNRWFDRGREPGNRANPDDPSPVRRRSTVSRSRHERTQAGLLRSTNSTPLRGRPDRSRRRRRPHDPHRRGRWRAGPRRGDRLAAARRAR